MLSHSPPFKQSSLVFPFRASSASGLVLGTRNIWVYFQILSIFVNSCFCFVHRGNSNLREHKISFFVGAESRSKREPLVPNDPRGRKLNEFARMFSTAVPQSPRCGSDHVSHLQRSPWRRTSWMTSSLNTSGGCIRHRFGACGFDEVACR